MVDLEICFHCGDDTESLCLDCGDALCSEHAQSLPGYENLFLCSECLEHRAEKSARIAEFVRASFAAEFVLGGRAA